MRLCLNPQRFKPYISQLHLLFELYFTGSSRLTNYGTTQILLYILRVIH